MFDKFKIKIPQTWDEFLAVCETLKNNDIIPIAMDSEWWVPQFFWGSIISCNGGDANWTAKLENGEIKINNPIFVDSIKKLKILLDKGYMPNEWTGLKHEQSKDLMLNEEIEFAYLDQISILPEYKRKGIASSIFKEALPKIQTPIVAFIVEKPLFNKASIYWHQSNGFEFSAISDGDYKGKAFKFQIFIHWNKKHIEK